MTTTSDGRASAHESSAQFLHHDTLQRFMRPGRVAIVGASRNTESIASRPARYLREWGFPGDVVLVNPNASNEPGSFPVFPSIEDAGPIDLAMILLPAPLVLEALESCSTAGVAAAISIASGFEGEAGAILADGIRSFVRSRPGLRLLGPNCVGLVSPTSRTALTFSSVLNTRPIRTSGLGVVSQSGAIANAVLLALHERGTGVAHWVSTGNEFDVGALELTLGMLNDPDCNAVGLFVEGLTDAHLLPEVAECIERTNKPVVVLRSASSARGRQAAFGHTARVVGDDHVARAALAQAGMHLVDGLAELCDVLTVLAVLPARSSDLPCEVGVVSVSGGVGVLATDAIEGSRSLRMASLDGSTADELQPLLPAFTSVSYPLDIGSLDDTASFMRAIELTAGAADAAVAIVSSLAHNYDDVALLSPPAGSAVVVSHLSPEERFSRAQMERLAERSIAVVPTARGAVRGLDAWAGRRVAQRDVDELGPAQALTNQLGIQGTSARIGPLFGDLLSEVVVVKSEEEAVAAWRRLDSDVAVKADGQIIAHRTEVGAVRTSLSSADDVRQAFHDVNRACVRAEGGDEVLVQAMSASGVEVMLSVVRDSEVGVAVLLRPGGVLVEGPATPTLVLTGHERYWPIHVQESSLGWLLAGPRGRPRADDGALIKVGAHLRNAVQDDAEIVLLECNPVIVHEEGHGLTIVDAITYLSSDG